LNEHILIAVGVEVGEGRLPRPHAARDGLWSNLKRSHAKMFERS
jgi:hypothetical protein